MKPSKIIAVAMILMLIFAYVPVAHAASNVTVDALYPGEGCFTGSSGVVYMNFVVINNTGNSINMMEPVCSDSAGIIKSASLYYTDTHTEGIIPSDGLEHSVTIEVNYESAFTGTLYTKMKFNFASLEPIELSNVKLFVPSPWSADPNATASDQENSNKSPYIRLSSKDSTGTLVKTPCGNYGDAVQVRIPLLCERARVSQLRITPVLSSDVSAFPFDINELDYTLTYSGDVAVGRIIEFAYDFTLSKTVTAGVKKVDFKVSYYNQYNGFESTTISIYVNVIKGAAASNPNSPTNASAPKVIIDSYSISPDKIYAGETFTISLVLRNTSSTQNVSNLQVVLSEANGKLLPADNGSNTFFVSKIAKGETVFQEISLQSAPDLESKSYTLSLDLSYDGSENTGYTGTASIAIPIQQKIRLKFDEPIINDTPFVEQPLGVYLSMYNLGKSTVYNCMVDVEGDGLAMEETYFGGNVTSGNTMRADFNIIPSVAGQIDGAILVTYENAYGEQMTERMPITLYVEDVEPIPEMPEIEDPTMQDGASGGASSGLLWWIIGGVLLVAGIVILIVVLKNKRKKELEAL